MYGGGSVVTGRGSSLLMKVGFPYTKLMEDSVYIAEGVKEHSLLCPGGRFVRWRGRNDLGRDSWQREIAISNPS